MCKFSQKSIVKKIQIVESNTIFSLRWNLYNNIPAYNFLTINFYENSQEYFFVQNQILNIKNEKEN